MNLLVKIGLAGLFASGTATAIYADPAGGWLSPNGLGGAGVSSTALAQAGGPTPSGPVTSAAPNSQPAPGQGMPAEGSTTAVTLSLVEIQLRVKQLHEQTRADARHIQHLQQIARKEKDVIKLNCVNDKLVQVKPQMNIADLGEAELESALDAERMTILDGITQAAESVRRLREEADQCIGEPTATGGDSSNSFTGPDSPDDPTKGFDQPDIEAPGYASPYN